MQQIYNIIVEIFNLINEMSPYLLLGFLLAGVMHAFMPKALYSRYLAGNDMRSVVAAALLGIPLPLCSCGVIPTAMSLHREGASKGATVSFLIATPQTGVDSIIATMSLMGLPFAIIRPIAALLTAVFGGQMVNLTDRQTKIHETQCECCCEDETQKNVGLIDRFRNCLHYAFVEMMQDIGKWLVIGLVVAGLITVLVPDSFFAIFKDNTMLSILVVLCIAIPMYICATGSIPIAVALMMKGLTPGAALVLLMAGPACNLASIIVISKALGRKTLVTYLVSIIVGSVLFGIGIDLICPASWFALNVPTGSIHNIEGTSWFSIACTIVLAMLLMNAFLRRHDHCHCHEK